uniref:Uncharacterized protein n=1 Tax=Aegilops tauschii subsp. strangulata TaxID=200361 RepID=A0A453SSR8_AEGTS
LRRPLQPPTPPPLMPISATVLVIHGSQMDD